ncbi:MAG: porin family protein [Paludibacter sp.]|nr:porin family protein [Paludibacter sp.]
MKISKIIGLVILILAAIVPCKAQEAEGIELGVKGGLNLSDLYTTDASVSDLNYGLNAGVYAKLNVTNRLAIQPEFYVSTKGASIRYNNALLTGTANFQLTYLELPVLGAIKLSQHLSLHFGPYVSCLVGAKVMNGANVTLFNFEQNIDINKFNWIDAGLILGAGIEVRTVTVGLQYTYGFVKVGRTQTFLGTTYKIPDTNNGVVSFYLAIPINKMEKNPITNQYQL